MKCVYTYFKSSITGNLIVKQEFTDTQITGIPAYFYVNNKEIPIPDLTGYVRISEKHYYKLSKKRSK